MKQLYLGFILFSIVIRTTAGQQLALAENGRSDYSIIVSQIPTETEKKAAAVLKDYFHRVTGINLPVGNSFSGDTCGIYIGNTTASKNDTELAGLPADGFIIHSEHKNLFIRGKGSKGTLYAVYAFIEKFMDCHKWDAGPASVTASKTLILPEAIYLKESPAFQYREVYLPPAFDDEYLDWHRLQRFEALWGIWGHSFFKWLSPKTFFASHPEYFSMVNGQRKASQLCLSNPTVLAIFIEKIRVAIANNPKALYWSISPNDENGFCTCPDCRVLDEADGGPQGSLLHFVNAIASRFPTKIFTTLAYGYSTRPPDNTKPAKNVIVLLSSSNVFRSSPLTKEKTAGEFRNNLTKWKEKGYRIFVWDYCTQFTNYLTPFPVVQNFQPDFSYLLRQGVSGVFEQGNGLNYGDMSELKAYVAGKLLWNPNTNADSLTNTFMKAYYRKAANEIHSYLALLQKNVAQSGTNLDIYGNPVNDHRGYLSPFALSQYEGWLQSALALTVEDSISHHRIQKIKLSTDFVRLQQARFFGKEKEGMFKPDGKGNYILQPELPGKVHRFIQLCEVAGVRELSESGTGLQQYQHQWDSILSLPHRKNLAAGAGMQFVHPFVPEYPAKRERTLVDETPGYEDFSYNWLCFYNVPMETVMDMGSTKKINSITLRFLEDARHWIFRPSGVQVGLSKDGIHYRFLPVIKTSQPKENFSVNFIPFGFKVKTTVRFIKIRATNFSSLPEWRYDSNKKPMIACDEIWVE